MEEIEFGRNRRSLEMKGGGERFGWDGRLYSESEKKSQGQQEMER